MFTMILQALYDLVGNCIYHPVLDTIGLHPGSPLFGLIIDTRCQ